jgi:aminodeoxyfutalosine synthase
MMTVTLEKSGLAAIAEKVRAGERLTRAEGESLFEADLFALGALADEVRVRRHGDVAYYNRNAHLNPTNVCIEQCLFCGFARRSDDEPGAFTMEPEAVFERIRNVSARAPGLTEIHVVGGLHPTRPFDYYLDVVRAVKRAAPFVTVKAYTAEEIDHFARITGLSLDAVLAAMKEARSRAAAPRSSRRRSGRRSARTRSPPSATSRSTSGPTPRGCPRT